MFPVSTVIITVMVTVYKNETIKLLCEKYTSHFPKREKKTKILTTSKPLSQSSYEWDITRSFS